MVIVKKKEWLLIAAAAIVVCLVLGFWFVNSKDKDNTQQSQTTGGTTNSVQQTTDGYNVTTDFAEQNTEDTSESSNEETTAQTVVDETAEILKVVYDSVNLLKSDQADFVGHKVQKIDIQLVDSSAPMMNSVVNGIISLFANEEAFDYDFTDGVSVDPENGGNVSSYSVFPPGDKPFSLQREGVARAVKTADGVNTVYTVVIVPEKSTLENPRPPHHNAGADTLDLSEVEIPIVTMNRVDFDYPGAEISVTISPEGKIVGYREHLRINGTGEVSGLGMTGYGTLEGYMEEKWDIQWK